MDDMGLVNDQMHDQSIKNSDSNDYCNTNLDGDICTTYVDFDDIEIHILKESIYILLILGLQRLKGPCSRP